MGLTQDDSGDRGVSAHVRDLQATMLHLLNIDHNRLAVKFQGLDVKLTGVEPAQVLTKVLA